MRWTPMLTIAGLLLYAASGCGPRAYDATDEATNGYNGQEAPLAPEPGFAPEEPRTIPAEPDAGPIEQETRRVPPDAELRDPAAPLTDPEARPLDPDARPARPDEPDDELDPAADTARAEHNEYVSRFRDQLRSFESTIEDLRARSDEIGDDAREAWDRQMANLDEKRQQLRSWFDELVDAGLEEWKELRLTIDDAREAMEHAIEDVRQSLDEQPASDETP